MAEFPKLSILPVPPIENHGWPWTEENRQPPDAMPNGSLWPLVSIVTPSYNQGQYLEETIRSVLLQGYPNLEYLIIDGGSTDNSVEIIRKYEPWLAYWVSEPDNGQSEALNKGFSKSTGEIIGWLNADDLYAPGAVAAGTDSLSQYPEAAFVYGDWHIVDEFSDEIIYQTTRQVGVRDLLLEGCLIPQQSTFFRRSILMGIGGLDPDLNFVMDYDLFLRLLSRYPARRVAGNWGKFRLSTVTKTSQHQELFWPETIPVFERIFTSRPDLENIKEEVFRRARLRAGLNYLINGKLEPGLENLRTAFQGVHYPFGDPNSVAQQIISLAYHHSYIPLKDKEAEKLLDLIMTCLPAVDREVAGQVSMIRAFAAYKRNDRSGVRCTGSKALYLSKHARANRGLYSILTRSLLP